MFKPNINNMKKVFFIIPNLDCGGAERVTITFAKHLNKFNFSPTIINIGSDEGQLKESMNELPIITLGKKSVFSSLILLLRILRKEKPDFIFSSLDNVSVLLLLISFLFRGSKIIVRVPTMPGNKLDDRIKEKIVRSLGIWLFRNAYRVISQTDEMKKEVLQKYNVQSEKIITINNPLDIDYMHSKLEYSENPFQKENTLNFITVGNISYAKGIDILIKAFSRFVIEHDNVQLYIIGRKESLYARKLIKIVKDTRMDVNVHFLGFRTNPFLYMKFCDAFILSSRMEGLPNVLLEANYLNKPIISTRCVPYVEKIISDGKNGFIVENENVDQMHLALKKILTIKNVANKNVMEYNSKSLNDFIQILS